MPQSGRWLCVVGAPDNRLGLDLDLNHVRTGRCNPALKGAIEVGEFADTFGRAAIAGGQRHEIETRQIKTRYNGRVQMIGEGLEDVVGAVARYHEQDAQLVLDRGPERLNDVVGCAIANDGDHLPVGALVALRESDADCRGNPSNSDPLGRARPNDRNRRRIAEVAADWNGQQPPELRTLNDPSPRRLEATFNGTPT
jgi:hypothetical protein